MTAAEPTPTVASTEDPTIGRLVADATRDISTLVQHEIALAKSELKVSATAGGIGVAFFAVAAFLGLLSIIFLSIAGAHFLSMTGLHLAWCYLIVFGVYALLIATLVLLGIKKVKKVRAPERAIHQAQETKLALTKRGTAA
ncbi:phage holin family protein [Nocardioides massiliensis]|uniref:Phage holin family protein n=1 Tax=Nocardioides massiliensis TaxID=1325935 RepID=A0ABT9NKM5_9ACTN|nr:phage holin family protein [Nocardioides massiliensis]MDP9820971.1 hypothetical protein [Nocardioides massiliensis]